MSLRTVAQAAVLSTLISCAGDEYSQTVAGESGVAVDRMALFGPVFEIMTVPAGDDSPGCRGCHIGRDALGPLWGQSTVDTAEETLNQLEQERPDLLVGGRTGTMGSVLHSGGMPRLGTPWNQDQLDLLDAWLVSYE